VTSRAAVMHAAELLPIIIDQYNTALSACTESLLCNFNTTVMLPTSFLAA